MKALALALALAATPAAAEPCAVALILALDVSGSVDPREWALQTGGIADAFRTPELREAALALGGPLHIAVTQWTGAGRQALSAPWRPLGNEAALDAFAAEVETLARAWRHFSTAIGEAIRHATAVGRAAPADCRRKVIDVSGDGVSNESESPATARLAALAEGWTINGLAIAGAEPPPAEHYRQEVIIGPGAFVEQADGFEDYPRAMLRKLLREIRSDALVAAR